MPLYASPEQLMRDRSEYARKGIARGRSAVALKYADGVLFVAENPSTTLHKVSEIYDRIGFCAAGRYSEYESLRRAGIRHVDLWGYSYDRRDVSARQLANVYAQTLGQIFTDQVKPFEVEICVAEVGTSAERDQLYRLSYDGSIVDEPRYLVMGGQTEPIVNALKESYADAMEFADAVRTAVRALNASNGESAPPVDKLEVAVLERNRPRRAFRRIPQPVLRDLVQAGDSAPGKAKRPVEDVELPESTDSGEGDAGDDTTS